MKKLPAVVLTLALSVTGCGAPVQTTRGWVLVENPRHGTLDAKPEEREYVWVREDRVQYGESRGRRGRLGEPRRCHAV